MDREYDLYGIIRDIIIEQTRYLRHYIAKVENNNDPDMKGKVFVTVPALGWDTPDKGQWAIPRHMHGLSIPAMGEYVEVYFINGSVHTMAYMGIPMEVMNMIPKNYTSNFDHIIFEAPGDQNTTIKYNENTKQLDILAGKIVVGDTNNTTETDINGTAIKFNAGTEAYVLGTALDTWMTNTLKVWADTHTHAFTAPAGPVGVTATPLTAPTNYLSTAIMGK